mmetsp:Transcript_8726/g.27826  ORF Transcript_8726/g.27826 Transcript_8726/m.27826 type:complete len:210 (-) Transcript_8726:1259-1888(-)
MKNIQSSFHPNQPKFAAKLAIPLRSFKFAPIFRAAMRHLSTPTSRYTVSQLPLQIAPLPLPLIPLRCLQLQFFVGTNPKKEIVARYRRPRQARRWRCESRASIPRPSVPPLPVSLSPPATLKHYAAPSGHLLEAQPRPAPPQQFTLRCLGRPCGTACSSLPPFPFPPSPRWPLQQTLPLQRSLSNSPSITCRFTYNARTTARCVTSTLH